MPLDGSLPATGALRVGERLADRWGAELKVLTLIEKSQIPAGVHHLIEKQVARIGGQPTVDVRPLSYSVAEDIAGEVDLVDDTFVVMSSWARGRAAGLAPNIAEEVFRLVRQPMLLVGPTVEDASDWPNGPLHLAVDRSHFGETVVRSAALFAKSLSLEVRLVTVVDPSTVPTDVNPAIETNDLIRLADDARAITGRAVSYDVLHGTDPGREIHDYARRYGASAIAMATHVRSGTSRLAHGSVAMDVVGHAHCPVLIDRPPVDEG